jgi:hypothetical protein
VHGDRIGSRNHGRVELVRHVAADYPSYSELGFKAGVLSLERHSGRHPFAEPIEVRQVEFAGDRNERGTLSYALLDSGYDGRL